MDSFLKELQKAVKNSRSFKAALNYIKALEHELKIPESDRYKDKYEGWKAAYPKNKKKDADCQLCLDGGEIKNSHGKIKDCPCGVWYPNKYPDM